MIVTTPSQDTLTAWLREALVEGVPETTLGQRRHPRVQWVMYVEIGKVGNADETFPCRIRDISAGGVGLFCHQDWRIDEQIRICRVEQPDQYVEGRVAHCNQTVGGYLVGVEVALPESHADSAQIKPCDPGGAGMFLS